MISSAVSRLRARPAPLVRPGSSHRIWTSSEGAGQECLDHVIVLNDRHLRRVLREFVPYYNVTRPHRRLNLEPPAGARHVVKPPGARLRAQPVLGGLHHAYEWAA